MHSNLMRDKVVLVTGGASGIGRASALLLAREGGRVVVADVDASGAQAVADEILQAGHDAQAVALDVSDEGQWEQAINQVLAQHGRLDVLVNNAGVSLACPTDAMTLDQWHRVMRVNLDGVFLGTKWAIGAMKRIWGGSIVNVASVSGITPSPTAAAYCASKAAVRMFSRAVAIECADAGTNIRVNLVTPGGVRTPMWERMPVFQDMVATLGSAERAFAAMEGQSPSKLFFSPDDVARAILYLASDASSHLTGTEIVLDRGHAG